MSRARALVPVLVALLAAGCRNGDGDEANKRRDCDDTDPTSFPGATEVCDGADNDCNGFIDDAPSDPVTWHRDRDGDAHGNPTAQFVACFAPPGWVVDGTDCDDDELAEFPSNAELCDGLDNDCNGQVDDGVLEVFYADVDSDGYGNPTDLFEACEAPPGYLEDDTDCDDLDEESFPGNTELCDGADNDCNGQVDEGTTSTFHPDRDGDGYGSQAQAFDACVAPAGWITDATDCNDSDSFNYPSNAELCDGYDNDCDDVIDNGVTATFYTDADGDQYGNPSAPLTSCSPPPGFVTDKTDCDDGHYTTWPGAWERCDGVDNDCDGLTDNSGLDSDNDTIDNCNDATVYSETFNTCVGGSANWGTRGWSVTQFADMTCCGAQPIGMPQQGTPTDNEAWQWCGGILNSGNVNMGHSMAVGADHGELNVFTVQAMVGAGGVNVDAVGIVLNYTGPGDFYLVRWDDPNNAYARPTSLEFIRCVAGQCGMLDRQTPVATAGTGYTSFEVRVRYDAIDIYVANVLQMSTITNGGDIGPGRVGVYAFDADTGSRVDSLAIYQP